MWIKFFLMTNEISSLTKVKLNYNLKQKTKLKHEISHWKR
jgi:hypothetical protein